MAGKDEVSEQELICRETFMILTICLTFVGTTMLYAAALFLACRRVMRHLQGKAPAIAAVVEHVLVPLFGRRNPSPSDEDSQN
jgi:hypothetical protein